MLGMIKATTHKRIVAEKEAEIAGLMKRLTVAEEGNCYADLIIQQQEENCQKLIARLAPFTKIRNRDSRGRFIKDTVA